MNFVITLHYFFKLFDILLRFFLMDRLLKNLSLSLLLAIQQKSRSL